MAEPRAAMSTSAAGKSLVKRYKLHQLAATSSQDLQTELAKDASCDVNVRDRNRTTPLHHAVYYNKAKSVKLLLDAKADIDSTDRDGSTPLHVASYIGSLTSVKSLIKAGASVNMADERGHTALHKACFSGNPTIVQYLLQNGAKLSATNRMKQSGLHLAAALGKAKVLSVLLDAGLALDLRDANSYAALHAAAAANQVQSLQALLSHGAATAAKDWAGRTALHLAAAVGSEGCAALLIAQGAAVDALDDDRCSPLHHAAWAGHADVVQVLLQHGADVDLRDSSNMTAFGKASFKGHKRVVEMLLYDAKHRGLTMDHPPIREGLLAAAAGGSIEVAELLLSQNVDAEYVWPEDGCSALSKAAFFGHIEIVRLLVEQYKATSLHGRALHAAAHMGHLDMVNYLLRLGCSAAAVDAEGGTALHSAAYNGHLACAEALIAAGVNVNAKDSRGNVAIHIAARNGHAEVVRVLLAKAPDSAAAPDNTGMRGLHHAIGHPSCVALLLEQQSAQHIDDQDNAGWTALHRAVSMNKAPDAVALIRAGASLDLRDKSGKKPLELPHSLHEALTDVLAARARLGNRDQYEEAARLFNEKPKKAVEFLRSHKLVRDTDAEGAVDLAEFLWSASKTLDLKELGEFISEPGEFAAAVLQNYLSHFHFTGQSLEQAVRAYLLTFRLPGEAQRIDRVMQGFASRFHHDNPDMFSHEDTAYLLAFSMIMLQTDAHNPAIKKEKKMTKQQFIGNNRAIDQGRDLPGQMLGQIYDNIITTPIKMETGAVSGLSLANVETTGALKMRAERGRWAKQWVVLRDNCIYYFASEKDRQPQGIIPLENLAVRSVPGSPLQFEIICPADGGTGGGSGSGGDGGGGGGAPASVNNSNNSTSSTNNGAAGQYLKACRMESGVLVPDLVTAFQFEASAEQEADHWSAKIRASIIGNPVRELIAQRRLQSKRAVMSTQQFSESASSHLGPQLQMALHMCVLAAKGGDAVLAEYPGTVCRDPHGMLRYYLITNENSQSQFVVLVSHLWRDLEECESWAESPTASKLLEMCKALRRSAKDEAAAAASPLASYPYRAIARKTFEQLCDDVRPEYGLFVVAHGIGGPLAPIIARALVRSKFKVRKVLTFGEPAVFTKRGVEKHVQLPYYRITHSRDAVACFFPGFWHAGTEVMAFADGTVTIVPSAERDESKGFATKVISSMYTRAARELLNGGSSGASGGAGPNSPGGSLKGLPKAMSSPVALVLQAQVQGRPSGSALGFEEMDRDKSFQYLLWEENRVNTYATLFKNPEQMRVVFFESKRNEI